MKKIRVAAVSYLNTKPLLYGLKHHPVLNEIELVEDYPSRIAQMLIEDKVDIGLIPVAATLQLKEWSIVGNYCIGSTGKVASVCLFSQVPMEEIETVLLDYQSRTSVNLARILLKEYWKKDIQFIEANGEDYIEQIKGTVAGVVIGDRALIKRKESKYIYDLAEAWHLHTGLSFVFAAWISNKRIPGDFIASFDEANAMGLSQIDKVIRENPFPYYDLKDYYNNCISYTLDSDKRNGLQLFLSKLS
ncbi:MAG TPA: menaquinone biosynthesis protein [Flavisolibacter sp.]|nr:menaquinone biosynthesis protein [Flavisolibacter sp.]